MGSEMKVALEEKLADERERKKSYVEARHHKVFQERSKKQAAERDRIKAKTDNAIAIGLAAQKARAERKEETKATVRREEQAAKDYAAKVRYETRPEVREEGASFFQALRTEAAENARQKAQVEREDVLRARDAYQQMASKVKSSVDELHAASHASRAELLEKRRSDAYDLKERLNAERERKKEIDAWNAERKKSLHAEVHTWRYESQVE